MIPPALASAVRELRQADIAKARRLHGGDLSDVWHLALSDGKDVVAKSGAMVMREARMLRRMARTGAPVPDVLGYSGTVLLLEHLPEGPATPAGWAALGTGLRSLHGACAEDYGWDEDYAFGSVTISNTRTENWASFWAERRLMHGVDKLPSGIATRVEKLAARLPDLLPATPPPALLHGDLWSGNTLFGGTHQAWLIDPACYHGDAEVDLAMLHLFGTPDGSFWEGYGPPVPDWRERLPIYQLWPALVHLRLFGAGYQGMVCARLDALGV